MTRIINRLRSREFWADALERAGATAVQAVAALGLVMPVTLLDVDWYTVGGVGIASGVGSVLWSLVSMPGVDAGLPWWQAIAYRAGKTFAVSLAAVLSTNAVNAFELDWSQAMSAAAVAALVAVGKNLATPPIETAATLTAFAYTSDVTDDTMIQVTQTTPTGIVESHVVSAVPSVATPVKTGSTKFKSRT